MASQDTYDASAFPPFAVTVDISVFTIEGGRLQVALIQRGQNPYLGRWALPGGFVRPDEDLLDAAERELVEETGLTSPTPLQQLGAYGSPNRDPRMRIVTVAHWTIVPGLPEPEGGTDAAVARLFPVDEVLKDTEFLAFDHHQIVTDALAAARKSLEETPVALGFCTVPFTIAELRSVYEVVWGTTLDPGNFQKKVLETCGFVQTTGERRHAGRGRPPELYQAGDASSLDPPFRRPSS